MPNNINALIKQCTVSFFENGYCFYALEELFSSEFNINNFLINDTTNEIVTTRINPHTIRCRMSARYSLT